MSEPSYPPSGPVHPVLACLGALESALKDVADVQPVFMCAEERARALVASVAVEGRLSQLQLRVLAVSGDVAAADGMRNPGTWLAHRARLTRGDGARRWRWRPGWRRATRRWSVRWVRGR